jgi:iron complex outermembrane recepter protein
MNVNTPIFPLLTATLSFALSILAQADEQPFDQQTPPKAVDAAAPQTSASKSEQLDEIVVSAQKRSERLVDVPAAITAISGERLEALNVQSLTDLAGYVPSLTISSYGAPGMNSIELRGLGAGYLDDFAGPLVATYIDDLPVGSSTSAGRGNLFGLDLVPYDMERVEVLEGPQGTLYGANAMAGLIKYTLRQPDLNQFEARAGTDIGHVSESDGVDWAARGAVNMPIVQGTLAARLSGVDQENAGYIDNIGTGREDANHSSGKSGRAALLWQATDALSVHATILAQDSSADDTTSVLLNTVTMRPVYTAQTTDTHFPQVLYQQTRNYSAGLDWTIPFATLTSVAGWSTIYTGLHEDFGVPFAIDAGFPVGTLALYQLTTNVRKFVEETRLTSPANQRIQWIAGAYYTDEHAGEDDYFPTFTSSYVPLGPSSTLWAGPESYLYKELAGFGNVTYKFTDQFDLSAGERYSSYRQSGCTDLVGIEGTGLQCSDAPSKSISIWSADARYHLNPDAMVYARVATGYRPGGPNGPSTLCDIPAASNPDRTKNYEVGFKGELLDDRLQINSTVYHIDWTDIQLNIDKGSCIYLGNGGTAVSNGAEVSMVYQVTEGLRLNTAFSYTHAYLTQDIPAAGGDSGNQLPLSARFSGSVTGDYTHPIDGRTNFVMGGSYRYKDSTVSQFVGSGAPYALPPQNIVDLYTGVVIKELSIRLIGKNVFNNRSYLGLQYVNDPAVGIRAIPVQPPTLMLSADYKFL